MTVNIIYKALCLDDFLHKWWESLTLILGSLCTIIDHTAVKIDFYFITCFDFLCRFLTLNDRKSDIDRISIEILAKVSAITQLMPEALIAIGACSLEEPHPKFFCATMISPGFTRLQSPDQYPPCSS